MMLERAIEDVQLEEVTSVDRLEPLATEWSALCDRCAGATPFQRPEWLLPWCRRFGFERAWVLVIRQGRRLVALAPFVVSEEGGTRVLRLLGAGVTDYLDALVAPELGEGGGRLLLQALAERGDRYEVCELAQLRSGSVLLRASAPAGWTSDVEPEDVSPVISLPWEREGLAEVVSPRLLANLRYAWRRAERLGAVWAEPADGRDVDWLVDCLVQLHGARSTDRGQQGVLADARIQGFHREVARGFLARRTLRLQALRLDGHVAAVSYGFRERRRTYHYLSGFDRTFEQLSPGALAMQHAIERAVHEGVREFDFLRGQGPTRRDWGAKNQPLFRRRLRPPADR